MTRREAMRGLLLGPGAAAAMIHAPAATARLTAVGPIARLTGRIARARFRELMRRQCRAGWWCLCNIGASGRRAVAKLQAVREQVIRTQRETVALWKRWNGPEGWLPHDDAVRMAGQYSGLNSLRAAGHRGPDHIADGRDLTFAVTRTDQTTGPRMVVVRLLVVVVHPEDRDEMRAGDGETAGSQGAGHPDTARDGGVAEAV